MLVIDQTVVTTPLKWLRLKQRKMAPARFIRMAGKLHPPLVVDLHAKAFGNYSFGQNHATNADREGENSLLYRYGQVSADQQL